MSIEGGIRENPEQTRAAQVRLGSQFFIAISREYPASVPAQGLALAKKCKEAHQRPLPLMQVVQHDEEAVAHIIRAAESVHKDKLAGRNLPSLDNIAVTYILELDGIVAEEAMILDIPVIDALLAEYADSMKSDETKAKYRGKVMATINDKQRAIRDKKRRT